MALRTGRQSNAPFMNRRIGIHFGLDPMNSMTGRTGWGIGSSSHSQNPMDTLHELLGNLRMTTSTGLRNIGSKDRRFWIDQRPKIMTPVATDAGHLPGLPMNTLFEFISRDNRPQGMLSHKFDIGVTAIAGLIDVRLVGL